MARFSNLLLLACATITASAASLNTEPWAETVVNYNLVVSEGLYNPDGGKERMVYFMNGKFASERLLLDEGDTVEIFVTSNISEPFSLHAHGIEQKGTPWMDGVPGVTQPLIQPGGNFTYKWTVNQHGFFHIHGHSKLMQDDGLFLGLFVRPAMTRERPFHQISSDAVDILQIVEAEANPHTFMINDWRHYTSAEVVEIWKASNVEPLCVQSILVNGQGATVCPPADELAALAELKGAGNVTALGCLPVDSPILNPPVEGFGPESNISVIPDNLWNTCGTAGNDNPLYTVTVDNTNTSWAVLSFVNAGGLWEQRVSVDEHPMYIFDVEGEYLNVTEPFDVVSIHSGMRVSAAIKLDKEPGSSYTIRVSANVLPQMISGYAVLQYANSSSPSEIAPLSKPAPGFPALPTSQASIAYASVPLTTAQGLSANATEYNPAGPEAAPYVPNAPPRSELVSQTLFFHMSRPNATVWALNSTGLAVDVYEDMQQGPLIWESVWPGVVEAVQDSDGPYANTSLVNARSLYVVPEKNSVVDLVFTVPNQDSPPHPIHKHFNSFWVIGSGVGIFNWTSVAEAAAAVPENFNFVNPPVRDGFNTPPASAATNGTWLAIRYVASNPGPMTVHCHLSQHMAQGMLSVILQDMDDVHVPAPYAEPS